MCLYAFIINKLLLINRLKFIVFYSCITVQNAVLSEN